MIPRSGRVGSPQKGRIGIYRGMENNNETTAT